MEKVLSIKIEGEGQKFDTYIPHPEISFIMKEFLNVNPVKVSFSDGLIINDVEFHSISDNEPMRANIFLSRNIKNDNLKQLENKVVTKLIELIGH